MNTPRSYDELVKHVVYKCRENNYPVAESLVAYILNIHYDEGKIRRINIRRGLFPFSEYG
jgi:hypothetical protein